MCLHKKLVEKSRLLSLWYWSNLDPCRKDHHGTDDETTQEDLSCGIRELIEDDELTIFDIRKFKQLCSSIFDVRKFKSIHRRKFKYEVMEGREVCMTMGPLLLWECQKNGIRFEWGFPSRQDNNLNSGTMNFTATTLALHETHIRIGRQLQNGWRLTG
ncbi:unnamed protein product [Linum tenue]|uniref:Uncharacterized protein n=1 Tax=Linum tenue TaxID=586396 RepID=A0AAV0IH25_9ROSI|nr:unnamed protein product [Linum tenue]